MDTIYRADRALSTQSKRGVETIVNRQAGQVPSVSGAEKAGLIPVLLSASAAVETAPHALDVTRRSAKAAHAMGNPLPTSA